jgi:hypothetical protein
MPHTVFFSWQSDTPASTGAEFIQDALGLAVALAEDTEIEKAIRNEGLIVDRDTEGVSGVPPIVDTVFDKIGRATIFVPDLTFVGERRSGQPTPNPNVLVEYGYALRALPYTRIIPVMNVAYGEPTPETMPFDMRHLRHPKCTYNLPEDATEPQTRNELRRLARALAEQFGQALRDGELQREGAGKEREPFPAAEPKDGQARFRARGEPLGETADRRAIALAEGPAMWLRVMPVSDPGKPWLVTDLKLLATQSSHFLLPLGSEAFGNYDLGHVYAGDGFGVYVHTIPLLPSPCVTFAFKTGEVWGIDTHHLAVNNVIPFIEPYFVTAFERYTRFLLDQLGVAPPYQWIAGIEGVKGRAIEVPLNATGQVLIEGSRGSCMSPAVVELGTHREGSDPRASLLPFFIHLYDSCNVRRPTWMDDFAWATMRY